MAGPAERLPAAAAGRLSWRAWWTAGLRCAAASGRAPSSGLWWGTAAAWWAAARVRTASRSRWAAATAWTRAAAAWWTAWRAAATAGLSRRAAAATEWWTAAGLSAAGLRPLGARLSVDYKTPWITHRA